MARPIAILRALALAYRRDWTAFQSLAGNNFFLITVYFLREAGTFVYLIIGLVLLFPLSTDPLRKIPSIFIIVPNDADSAPVSLLVRPKSNVSTRKPKERLPTTESPYPPWRRT